MLRPMPSTACSSSAAGRSSGRPSTRVGVPNLDSLPRRIRDIATLRGLGYTFREIGAQLNVTPQAVSLMLARHRRALASLGSAVELRNLSSRAVNVLARHGIFTREQAAGCDLSRLLERERNCGRKTLVEIENWIRNGRATENGEPATPNRVPDRNCLCGTGPILAAVLLWCAAGATMATAADPEKLRRLEEVEHRVVRYDTKEFSGWPANHGLWSWDDGREILVGFSCGPYVADKEGHKIGNPERDLLARSLDGGETWKMVETDGYVADGQEPEPLTEPIDFTAPGFALRVKMRGGEKPPGFYYSYDRGTTWRGPFLFRGLDAMPELADLPMRTPRTDYLVTGPRDCTVMLAAAKEGFNDRTFAVKTDDGGLTFSFVTWLIGPEDPFRAVMPQTVRLGPDEYLTLLRRRTLPPRDFDCWIDAVHSTDGGRTWSPRSRVAYTGVRDTNGSPPALLRLRDGRLVAAYANRSLQMLLCRVSENDGRTWGDEIIVRDDFAAGPGKHGFPDFGYPRLVERPDGRVAVIYYFSDKEHPRQHIAASIFSPDRTGGEVAIRREIKAAPFR
jgi:hypothetical protein